LIHPYSLSYNIMIGSTFETLKKIRDFKIGILEATAECVIVVVGQSGNLQASSLS